MRINEKLSWIRSSYLLHRMPGLRWLAERIGPAAYFNWIQAVAGIAYYVYPPDRRRVRYMRRAIEAKFPSSELPAIIKRNIRNRKWQLALFHGWAHWEIRHQRYVQIEGEDHLASALSDGKGAVLLSGHAHGFTDMVAPVLSQKGYKYNRVVRLRRHDQSRRVGQGSPSENLSYITLGRDVPEHMQALQRMRSVIRRNEVLHLLVRGFPNGKSELEIDFFYKRFFLDPATFQILEILQAPVLPCFAFCDERGRLLIEIHAALAPSRAEIMRGFGRLYSKYLSDRPEFAFFWRRMVRQQEHWLLLVGNFAAKYIINAILSL